MDRAQVVELAASWLLLAAGFGWLFSADYRAHSRLADHGVVGEAVVEETLPQIHQTVKYHYEAAGRTFEGRGLSWRPNPDLSEIKPGQKLVVYYDPANPSFSMLGDPRQPLQSDLFFSILGALMFSTALTGAVYFRLKERQEKLAAIGQKSPYDF